MMMLPRVKNKIHRTLCLSAALLFNTAETKTIQVVILRRWNFKRGVRSFLSGSAVDVCAQGHDCQHTCVSSGASYVCQCRVGYVLNADQKTCSRKKPLPSPETLMERLLCSAATCKIRAPSCFRFRRVRAGK